MSLSSHGGLLLLQQEEEHLSLASQLASCIEDKRIPYLVRHSLTEIIMTRIFQLRQSFFTDHIDLPLIQMSARMISLNRSKHTEGIRFSMVFSHDDQFTVIKLPIKKLSDLGMATIVFPEHHIRCVFPYRHGGTQETVRCKAEWIIKRIPVPYTICYALGLLCQDIRKLFQVSNNNDILCA